MTDNTIDLLTAKLNELETKYTHLIQVLGSNNIDFDIPSSTKKTHTKITKKNADKHKKNPSGYFIFYTGTFEPTLGHDGVLWLNLGDNGYYTIQSLPNGQQLLFSPITGVLAAPAAWLSNHNREKVKETLSIEKPDLKNSDVMVMFDEMWKQLEIDTQSS